MNKKLLRPVMFCTIRYYHPFVKKPHLDIEVRAYDDRVPMHVRALLSGQSDGKVVIRYQDGHVESFEFYTQDTAE
jgi:hypothetical protein